MHLATPFDSIDLATFLISIYLWFDLLAIFLTVYELSYVSRYSKTSSFLLIYLFERFVSFCAQLDIFLGVDKPSFLFLSELFFTPFSLFLFLSDFY
jgi:hypothetical protein